METQLYNKHLEEYYRLSSLLVNMNSFVKKHPSLTYIDFDYYTVHDLTLFIVEPNFSFESLIDTLNKINAILPTVKRIFAKPIINLKDVADVMPVEIVRTINQGTMTHLANHSANVANITRRGIKPRKLLTRLYEDDYGIYENLIFCNFIDDILSYLRKNARSIKDLVYANEIMEFNLLERVNHLSYFLAIGKLHTGYVRDFDRYCTKAKQLYTDILNFQNSIEPRLKKPVYKLNKKRNKNLPLKKTNIFGMQKDYHSVYKTYKYLMSNKIIDTEEYKNVRASTLFSKYFNFCQILSIFSIGHFNFSIDEKEKINLNKLNSTFTFKKWSIKIESIENERILLSIKKDITYKILLIPSLEILDEEDRFTRDSIIGDADEVIYLTPFEKDYLYSSDTYISVESIESFRRIQQILLRGMIYSSKRMVDCPFCGGKLKLNKETDEYECDSCRMIIKKEVCPETNGKYFSTSISHLEEFKVKAESYSKNNEWLYNRKVESSMFFRNITKIDRNLKPICPFCGRVHNEE